MRLRGIAKGGAFAPPQVEILHTPVSKIGHENLKIGHGNLDVGQDRAKI